MKLSPFDPTEMALRGKIGAAIQHARHDPVQTTAAAREARYRNLYAQVDAMPGAPSSETERERRMRALLSAQMGRASLARSRAARKRKPADRAAMPRPAAAGAVR